MMVSLLIYYLLMITVQLSAVSGQTFSLRQPATGPSSVCEGSDVTLQCVIVIISADNTTVTVQSTVWTVAPDGVLATTLPNHRQVFNATINLFTDLVITNVTLEDNNTVYSCSSTNNGISSSVVLNVTGDPPDDVNNVSVSLTVCGLVVQWSDPYNDPVCGTVWYTVTISTEGGILIITDNTTMTNYDVTGKLNSSTLYSVNVTASNNASSSDPTSMPVMTNGGLPSSRPNVTSVSTLSNRSFTVHWTMSDPIYDCTVIWTNLNANVVNNDTVPANINSYTVTGLNDNDNYSVSVAAVNMCGSNPSNPVAVNRSNGNISTSDSSSTQDTSTPTFRTNVTETSSESSTNTIVIIIPVVIATVIIVVAIIVIIFVVYWRKVYKEGGIKPNESDESKENNYAQPTGNSNTLQQEKNNEEYAYARNGPRGVVFPSTKS